MGRPESIAKRDQVPLPIHPDDLKRDDFETRDQYLATYYTAQKNYNLAKRLGQIQILGGFGTAINLMVIAATVGQVQFEQAKEIYNLRRQALAEVSDMFENGGGIKIKAAKDKTLPVYRWAGSGYHERQEVCREITGDEEFMGTYFRWSESDWAVEFFSSPLTTDKSTEWVYLKTNGANPNFKIVDVLMLEPE